MEHDHPKPVRDLDDRGHHSLRDLAEYFGVLEAVADQHKKHITHREHWKAWLSKRAHTLSELLSPTDDYPWEKFEGPPDEWNLARMAFAPLSYC